MVQSTLLTLCNQGESSGRSCEFIMEWSQLEARWGLSPIAFQDSVWCSMF